VKKSLLIIALLSTTLAACTEKPRTATAEVAESSADIGYYEFCHKGVKYVTFHSSGTVWGTSVLMSPRGVVTTCEG
jgi:hypothetical protein